MLSLLFLPTHRAISEPVFTLIGLPPRNGWNGLEEAKSDAEIAKSLADRKYELIDATYNLAGIEAMLGHRDTALTQLRELAQLGAFSLVLPYLNDYFKSLKDDPEFQGLIGMTT